MLKLIKPKLSTTGGTSDARFIRKIAPCLEFGLVGKTMHKVDEAVSLTDLKKLSIDKTMQLHMPKETHEYMKYHRDKYGFEC